MDYEEKTKENRLRRQADRCGYRLTKSRSRDPRAMDFGLYALTDVRTGGTVAPAIADRWTHSMSLGDVEKFLGEAA